MLTDQFTCDEPSAGPSRPMARTARCVEPVEPAPAGVWFLTSTAPGFVSGFVFGAAVDVQGGVPTS